METDFYLHLHLEIPPHASSPPGSLHVCNLCPLSSSAPAPHICSALVWNPERHFKVLSVSWDQACVSIRNGDLSDSAEDGKLAKKRSIRAASKTQSCIQIIRVEDGRGRRTRVGGVWPLACLPIFSSYFHSSGISPLHSSLSCISLSLKPLPKKRQRQLSCRSPSASSSIF